jgi:cell division GTPase FtsZ
MGMGVAKGEKRAKMAAQLAVSSPLLEVSIDGATGVLFNVIGGSDLAMFEIDEAAQFISDSVDDDANIIFGATIDPDKKDDIEITVLATGFDAKAEKAILENKANEMRPRPKATGLGGLPGKDEDIDDDRGKKAKKAESDTDEEQKSSRFSINFARGKDKSDAEKEATITDEEEDDLETPSFLRKKQY